MHIYTRELLDKHLLPELKEIALGLGITPAGNKTRRETWIAALAGQPFPLFESIAPWSLTKNSSIPIAPAMPIESPGAKIPPVSIVERSLESRPASRPERVARSENSPGVVRAQEPIEKSPGAKTEQKMSQSAIAEAAENSLGVEVEQAQEAIGNSPGVVRPHPAIGFPSLESALA